MHQAKVRKDVLHTASAATTHIRLIVRVSESHFSQTAVLAVVLAAVWAVVMAAGLSAVLGIQFWLCRGRR